MNVNELRKRLEALQKEANELCSQINQHIPARTKIGDVTLIPRTSGVDVEGDNYGFDWTNEQAKLARDYLIAAYPLDTAPDAGWVSVKERLPETGRKVLVFYTDCGGMPLVATRCCDGWVNPWDEDGVHLDITHWRELPERPAAKGGSSE